MGRLNGRETKKPLRAPRVSRAAPERAVPHAKIHRPRPPPSVPPEIVGVILDHYMEQLSSVKEKDRELAKLARCSRILQAESERRLYSDLEILLGTPEAAKIANVLQSRAAKYVRALSIYGYGSDSSLRRGRSASKSGVAALPFARMAGLKSLEVDVDSDEDPRVTPIDPQLFQLLEDLPENVLQEFTCRRHLHPSDLAFLGRQMSLKSLAIDFIVPRDGEAVELWTGERAFDNLLEFHTWGMADAACSLLRGSQIRFLTATHMWSLPREWTSFSSHLLVLDMTDCLLSPGDLEAVVEGSPLLELLLFTVKEEWEVSEVGL